MINMKKFVLKGNKPTRLGFGEALVELGSKNENVIVLGADVTGSVKTSEFMKKYPERFYNIGIAEQNATTIATGMALSGKIPFFSTYSAFAAFRNADQLRISVAYNNANVKIGGGHSGITVGPDGATHQSLEEMAMLRTLPNMTLVCPCDYEETKKATIAIGNLYGPAYLRFGRTDVPSFTEPNTPFTLGKAEIFREGTDVTIVACGIMVWEALTAAEKLEEKGISAQVINNHTIKPIDEETLVNAAQKTGAVVSAEEHQVHGGLGSAVAEVLAKNYPVPMEFVGMKDEFGGSGQPDELLEHYGFTWKEIYASVMKVLERKEKGFIGIRKVKDVAQFED